MEELWLLSDCPLQEACTRTADAVLTRSSTRGVRIGISADYVYSVSGAGPRPDLDRLQFQLDVLP